MKQHCRREIPGGNSAVKHGTCRTWQCLEGGEQQGVPGGVAAQNMAPGGCGTAGDRYL